MAPMAQPKSLRALAEAIDAFKKEAGGDAEYKPILEKLSAVTPLISEEESEPARDSDEDDHSFATAERRHIQRTAENAAASGGEAK